MKQIMKDVAEFMRACDQPVLAVPTIPPLSRICLREGLIAEEFNEFMKASEEGDLPAIADAIADLMYVLAGTALEYGIPLEAVWDEVQRSNMAKIDPETGKVTKNEAGKVQKPPGWTPPDIARVLDDASNPTPGTPLGNMAAG